MTVITAIDAGTLVCWNASKGRAARSVRVLHVSELERGTVVSDLADAGWRLAEFDNTGYRVLVRRTGERRWLAAWKCHVDLVDVHEVDTGVAEVTVDGEDTFSLVVELGAKRPGLAYTRCQ